MKQCVWRKIRVVPIDLITCHAKCGGNPCSNTGGYRNSVVLGPLGTARRWPSE